MGVLRLQCAAANPSGQILYGLAFGYAKDSKDEKVILIMSNSGPTLVEDFSWSLIHTQNRDQLPALRGKSTCTIDDKGIFTIVTPMGASVTTPVGAQLNTLNPSQGWTSIAFADAYGWQPQQSNILIPLKTAAGSTQLVQVLVGGTEGGIRFGSLDPTSKQFRIVGSWAMNGIVDVLTAQVAFANNILYYLSAPYTNPLLSAFPFTADSPTLTKPAPAKTFNADGYTSCGAGATVQTAAISNIYYCQCSVPGQFTPTIYQIDYNVGTAFGQSNNNLPGDPNPNIDIFVPMAGSTVNPSFVFLQLKNGTIYTYSMVRSGANTNTNLHQGSFIEIKESFSTDAGGGNGGGGGGDGALQPTEEPGGGLSEADIGGIATAAVVFLIIFFACCCSSKKKKKEDEDKEKANIHELDIVPVNTDNLPPDVHLVYHTQLEQQQLHLQRLQRQQQEQQEQQQQQQRELNGGGEQYDHLRPIAQPLREKEVYRGGDQQESPQDPRLRTIQDRDQLDFPGKIGLSDHPVPTVATTMSGAPSWATPAPGCEPSSSQPWQPSPFDPTMTEGHVDRFPAQNPQHRGV